MKTRLRAGGTGEYAFGARTSNQKFPKRVNTQWLLTIPVESAEPVRVFLNV